MYRFGIGSLLGTVSGFGKMWGLSCEDVPWIEGGVGRLEFLFNEQLSGLAGGCGDSWCKLLQGFRMWLWMRWPVVKIMVPFGPPKY